MESLEVPVTGRGLEAGDRGQNPVNCRLVATHRVAQIFAVSTLAALIVCIGFRHVAERLSSAQSREGSGDPLSRAGASLIWTSNPGRTEWIAACLTRRCMTVPQSMQTP